MESMKDLAQGANSEPDDSGTARQQKSLIANVYSTDRDDNYKSLEGWDWFDETAYHVTKGGGLLRRNLKRITPSGSHEEWYTRFQLLLAHYVGELVDETLPNGDEPEGPVPLMEFLGFDADDIARYLQENPEMAEEIASRLSEAEIEATAESDD